MGDIPATTIFGFRYGDVNAPGALGNIQTPGARGEMQTPGVGDMPTDTRGDAPTVGLFGERFGNHNAPPTLLNNAMDSLFEKYSPGSVALFQSLRAFDNPSVPVVLQLTAGAVSGLALVQSFINVAQGIRRDASFGDIPGS
jgi:hypothetical protein